MQIIVNGTAQQVEPACSIHNLLAQLALTHKRIAVEVNEQIIPRSRFSEYQLQAEDKVEIVQAIGGG